MTLNEINKQIKEEKLNLKGMLKGLPYSDMCELRLKQLRKQRLDLIKGWFK